MPLHQIQKITKRKWFMKCWDVFICTHILLHYKTCQTFYYYADHLHCNNYYISSPYNNPILKNREEEKESKYLEEEYLLILEKTNIIRLFFSFIND